MNGIKSDWITLRQVSYRAPYLVPWFCSLHINDIMSDIESKSNRKAMNRNWSNQKANPAL